MFDSIALRHQRPADSEHPLDLGFLGEAMLFYASVRVIADGSIFKQLLREMGPWLLLEYCESGFLSVVYLDDVLAIHTSGGGTAGERNDACVVHSEDQLFDRWLLRALQEIVGHAGDARELVRRFERVTTISSFRRTTITDAVREDLADPVYLESAASRILTEYAPDYVQPSPLRFRVHQTDAGLALDSNVNFEAANRSYHQRVSPTHSSLSGAYVLATLADVRGLLHFASEHSCEMAAETLKAGILNDKFAGILKASEGSRARIETFQEFVLGDSRAIAEALNARQHGFVDLLELLKRSREFRHWLHKQPADENLVRAYFREATASSWVDRLPPKTARWAVFTGLGVAIDVLGTGGLATVGGIALGAADTFLLDRLLRGWKPNQFIDKDLKEFITG